MKSPRRARATAARSSRLPTDTETLWAQSVRYDPQNAIALYGLGHEAAKRGGHDEAIELYTRAIEARESDTRAWFNRGISLVEIGEYDRAIDDFTVVLEREPENAWAWSNRGVAHVLLGELEPARSDLDRALELGFEYIPTLLARAHVAEQMGEDDEARAFRRRVRDIRMRGGR